MAGRLSKQYHEIILWAIIVAAPIFIVTHYNWTVVLISVPIILFLPTCYLALLMPIRCRVATRKGSPCRNRAYGVIFGCKQYHYSMKALARIGKHEQDDPRSTPNGRRRRNDGGAMLGARGDTRQVVTVEIKEGMKGRVSFCFTVLSGLCTVGPVVIIGAKWVISLI
jgi:hypothetical protein